MRSRADDGRAPPLTDLFLAPILFWLNRTPEGPAVLPNYPALARWYLKQERPPQLPGDDPPMPGQVAA